MIFACIDLETGSYIGNCTLPKGHYDAHGTEHAFDNKQYTLQSTHIEQDMGVMYFRLKK